MPLNLTRRLIRDHLVDGDLEPGAEIALRIDQTLTQDATGTLVMLMLEAIGLERIQTELSAQYVDHNLLQEDSRNADDHEFLRSACRRFGVWYSPPGNGISHPVHMQRFGSPGKTLLGADSHSCAAGSLGMLAIGAGGMDVAMAMAGEPFYTRMPKVMGVLLHGHLPEWISAKDVILELLRRYGVDGGLGWIVEYHGPGLAELSAMDRHVIANMGAELGATTSVFPSDDQTRIFLRNNRRESDWRPLEADPDARYDREEEIDLSLLEPLIATPSSPGNVVPVTEIAGQPVAQAYVGSSANPGYRDFAVVARMLAHGPVCEGVSLDINPTSRQLLETLIQDGHLASLIHAGVRLHQAGCNGCIGMGQAPATRHNSLRTVPRNFPGRSGSREDRVFLCSPETAAASALTGQITDPRTLGFPYPHDTRPTDPICNPDALRAPLPTDQAENEELLKGPNITSIPDFEPLPGELHLPILLYLGDDISTDEILPGGARVLPYRSNIPAISTFAFEGLEQDYAKRAKAVRSEGGHALVAGRNYGQGSSREHAALAPRYLGLRAVIAESFARIHRQNLINYGVLPLIFADSEDRDSLKLGEVIILSDLHGALAGGRLHARVEGKDAEIPLRHDLSEREANMVRAGGRMNLWRGNFDR